MKSIYASFALVLSFYVFSPRIVPVAAKNANPSIVAQAAENAPQVNFRARNGTPESQVLAYVQKEADAAGIPADRALFILRHESQNCGWGRVGYFDPAIQGDDGRSEGCWQIFLVAHPQVSRPCAESLLCSTAWAIGEMKKGRWNEWSTWACRYVWFPADTIKTFGFDPHYTPPSYCKP